MTFDRPHAVPGAPQAVPPPLRCSCPEPLLSERAVRKGAAETYCLRCGLKAPVRWLRKAPPVR
jgi:hypothetical protein